MTENPRRRECIELFLRNGDVEACRARYPELADEIERLNELRLGLKVTETPAEATRSAARQQLLTAVASAAPPRPARRLFRLGGLFAAGSLLLAATIGASAAGMNPAAPATELLQQVGLGKPVRDAIHSAIDSTPPGHERGRAVSAAACNAARDRSRLPEGAQTAPGQQDKTPEPCPEHEADTSQGEHGPGSAGGPSAPIATAIAGTPPGPERGQAVRDAACEARNANLPPAAQTAVAQDQAAPSCGQDGTQESQASPGQGSQGQGAGAPGGPPSEIPPGRGR